MEAQGLSKKQIRLLSFCIEQALDSSMFLRHGCIIVAGGKIRARGKNIAKSMHKGKIVTSLHAEVDALDKLKPRPPRNSTLYVVRLAREQFTLKESKPCRECIKVMRKHGVKFVIYSDGSGEIRKERVKNMKNNYITWAQEKHNISMCA